MDNRVLAARLVSSRQVSEAARRDRLLIKDLVLQASIGIHAHEKTATQRVRINVELEVDGDPHAIGDDIGNVVSYEHIVRRIKELIAAGHINLVETVAERMMIPRHSLACSCSGLFPRKDKLKAHICFV